MWDERGPFARRDHRTISINIDPLALGQPVLHAVAMQADAGAALDDLLQACDARVADRVEATGCRAHAACAPRLRGEAGPAGRRTRRGDAPGRPGARDRRALPADALAVYDGGHTTFWSNDFTPVREVRTRFHEPGMSQLGFGLPYAMALQAQQPRAAVVATSPATAPSASP
jgi:thiamine pyrophosphate-dependent acetolactate synthase large subunit-like protein